jgi:DNA-binding transcriptional MocR family regulator
MKYISTGSTAPQPQIAIAEFLKGGHFEPHLRRMRTQYQRNRDADDRLGHPLFPGGHPRQSPTRQLHAVGRIAGRIRYPETESGLHDQGVQIAVGSIFSASGKYRNCLRMNYAAKPTAQIEDAVRKVGAAAIQLLAETSELD